MRARCVTLAPRSALMPNAKSRTVIVGVGQVRNRPGLDAKEWNPIEPARLMAAALERAAADAGRAALVREADFVGCIPPMAWSYDDLPGQWPRLVGGAPREKLEPPGGGEGPVLLLDDVANRIAEGEIGIALLAGADCVYSRRRARAESRKLDWAPGGAGRPALPARHEAVRERARSETRRARARRYVSAVRERAAQARRAFDRGAPALRVRADGQVLARSR